MSEAADNRLFERVWAEALLSIHGEQSVDDVVAVIEEVAEELDALDDEEIAEIESVEASDIIHSLAQSHRRRSP